MISESLELSYAKKQADTREAIAAYEKAANNRDYLNKVHKLTLDQKFEMEQLANKAAREAEARAMKDAETKAKAEMQPILEAIHKAEMARNRAADDEKIKTEQMLTEIEKAKQQAYADTVKSIMASISPELVAALTSTANADMLETVTQAMSPYAMANGESVADVTNKLLRGTPLEGFIEKITSQG
ncbi:MAG: hypothetical protein IIU59_00275 [Alistipes sp.]|nr:hypothetical protein [Alistipes sp.]